MEPAIQEAWDRASKIIRGIELAKKLESYRHDPVGFGEKVLGESYTDEVKQVMQSVCDNRVTVAKSGNAVGKSHAAARIAAWFYKVFPDSKVFLAAAPPLENLRRILWGHLMTVTRLHPDLFEMDNFRSLEISRHEESFIAGVAIPTSGSSEEREAKFSGKHAPHLLFIVDEGDAVPDEVYRGIEGCMSGEFDRLLIMFNPRAAIGPVYYKENNNQAKVIKLSAINHPNVRTGENVIPGAVTRETTLRRINQWTRPLIVGERIDYETWELPDFLVGSSAVGLDGQTFEPLEAGYRKITNPAFSYMVLGEYPAQSDTQLISQVWIDNAVSRWHEYQATFGDIPPQEIQPVLGLDIAELGIDANCMIARYGGYVAKPVTWKGIDTDESAVKALEMYRKYSAQMIMVDGTGVGSSVAPSIARMSREQGISGVRSISVKVAKKPVSAIKSEIGEFHSLRDQLWWAVREWLRNDQGAMLPPDRLLLEELKTPSYSVKETGKIKITGKDDLRELLKRSPDRADALCLTFLPLPKAKVLRIGID